MVDFQPFGFFDMFAKSGKLRRCRHEGFVEAFRLAANNQKHRLHNGKAGKAGKRNHIGFGRTFPVYITGQPHTARK